MEIRTYISRSFYITTKIYCKGIRTIAIVSTITNNKSLIICPSSRISIFYIIRS